MIITTKGNVMDKQIKAEILKVVEKYTPAVQKSLYSTGKDKVYLQSIYVETACAQVGLEWEHLGYQKQSHLLSYTHKAILASFRARKLNLPNTLISEKFPPNGREGFLDDTKITASERKKEAQVQSGETNHNPTALHKDSYEKNKARIEGTK
jgi:hypothetical protein